MMHAKNGIRMALRDYAKFHEMFDELKPLTQAMYGLLNEAIRQCGLNEAETIVIKHRYVSPTDTDRQVESCSIETGLPERTVKYHSASILDKIHAYMNEHGEAYYARHNIRL